MECSSTHNSVPVQVESLQRIQNILETDESSQAFKLSQTYVDMAFLHCIQPVAVRSGGGDKYGTALLDHALKLPLTPQ